MNTYWDMWNTIKELKRVEDVNTWISHLEPAKGVEVNFYGVRVIDVDLLEALRNYKIDLDRDLRQPAFD